MNSIINLPIGQTPQRTWQVDGDMFRDVNDIFNALRVIQARGILNDVIDVTDFGLIGDGLTDNYAAFIALLVLFPGYRYYFPKGIYLWSNFPILSVDGIGLLGDGPGRTEFINQKVGGDFIVFQPTVPAGGTLLNFPSIEGIRISRTVAPVGATSGIKFLQCNGWTAENNNILNHPNGFEVWGGAAGKIHRLTAEVSALLGGALIGGSSLLRFENAPIPAGAFQQVFTTVIDKITLGGNKIIECNILIQGVDGLEFGSGYNAFAGTDLVRIQPSKAGKHCSVITFAAIYNDGINPATGTLNGIALRDDGFGGASVINDVVVECGTKFANLQTNALVGTHLNVQGCSFCEESFLNIASGVPINVTASLNGFFGIPIPWTPSFAWQTPGVNTTLYTRQFGEFLQKDGICTLTWDCITNGGLNYVGSAGALFINGNPIQADTSANYSAFGYISFEGITKALYTQFTPRLFTGGTTMVVATSGSGQPGAFVVVADIPSGTFTSIQGTITFHLKPRT